MTDHQDHLFSLLDLYCENRLEDEQFRMLESFLRADEGARAAFLEYTRLHGQLGWDFGLAVGTEVESEAEELVPSAARASARAVTIIHAESGMRERRRMTRKILTLACGLMIGIALVLKFGAAPNAVVVDVQADPSGDVVSGTLYQNAMTAVADAAISERDQIGHLRPLELDALRNSAVVSERDSVVSVGAAGGAVAALLNDFEIVAEVDRLLSEAWEENKIVPAPSASDNEWIRRAYLTLTGRIPSLQEVTEFCALPSERKRDDLVRKLVDDPRTAENRAVVWTNLLIGRSNSRGVDEDAMFEFLRNQFLENRPWMETVGELISAEGRSDQNGATNFLLAHLNDQATPATAVTARLFLGQQVHCTQCHDHPFARERRQQEFWGLNAFFKQAERQRIVVSDSDGQPKSVWTLTESGKPGMTFYETLRGQQKAVPPEFDGVALPPDASGRRRHELVKLLRADDEHQVARAMVNRVWASLFGYGFVNPVDDLGTHNPVSHPELFALLTDAFVRSDYDVRRLTGWMMMSKAFHLSSAQNEEFAVLDDPQEGGIPLFSRSYARPLGPEQVYDSIRVAIRSVADQPVDSSVGTVHRREWVEQFVCAYGTDENDEQLTFDGNIAQALLMMNGEELEKAIGLAAAEVSRLINPSAVSHAARRLALATLNREATENEERAFRSRVRTLSRSLPPDEALKTATEDMLWAYLNSAEFVSLH